MASSPSTSSSSTPTLNPAAQGSVWGWQQNSISFGEMGKFLFGNQQLSDVVLHCGVTAVAHIKAHKFILAATSPVFQGMFFGDQKVSDAVDVFHMAEDVTVVEVLLKVIYGFSHTRLLTVDNVAHIIRAAEKYKVHVAIALCQQWIGTNLNAASCLTWLEATQQFPPEISGTVTAEKCWKYIDQYAAEVLRSPKFLDIDHSLLVEILKRNSLHVNEYALYEAALKWADRSNSHFYSFSSNRKRAALGTAIYQIRFTLMSAKEFGEGPAQSGMLLPDEVSSIFLYMVTDKKPPIKFVTQPRIVVASGTFQVERFPATYGKREYVYDGDVLDSISFTVDREITLLGCGIYTCGKENHDMNVEVYTGADQVLRLHESGEIGSTPSTKYLTGPVCISSFDFQKQLLIPRSTLCTIQCGITGRDTDFGINGKEEANAKVILDSGNSVTYRFTFIPGPANEQHAIRSLTSRGQIPTIMFRP